MQIHCIFLPIPKAKGSNKPYINRALGRSSIKTTEVNIKEIGIDKKNLTSSLDSLYENFIFEANKVQGPSHKRDIDNVKSDNLRI